MGEAPPKEVEIEEEMPLPQDLGVMLQLGIFCLLFFYTLYFTSEIAIPIIMAFILYLVLQPSMRLFTRIHVPKTIAALLIISVFFSGLIGLAVSLSGPTAEWIARAPQSLTRLEERLSKVTELTKSIQHAGQEVEKTMTDDATVPTVNLRGTPLTTSLFSSTRMMVVGVLTTVVLLFFLLVSGDLFLRRFVEILPTLHNKKQAVEISQEIENSVSSYLLTITLMNAGVGVTTGIAAYFCGLSDPILWGSVAFLLNYIPILGPLCGIGGPLLCHPHRRRRMDHAAVACTTLHAQSGSGHHLPGVLVLDVGHRRSDLGGAHARDAKDRVRSHTAPGGLGAFYRR